MNASGKVQKIRLKELRLLMKEITRLYFDGKLEQEIIREYTLKEFKYLNKQVKVTSEQILSNLVCVESKN